MIQISNQISKLQISNQISKLQISKLQISNQISKLQISNQISKLQISNQISICERSTQVYINTLDIFITCAIMHASIKQVFLSRLIPGGLCKKLGGPDGILHPVNSVMKRTQRDIKRTSPDEVSSC